MNTASLVPYVYDKLILFVLVFSRISALFSTFIVFNRQFVNARIIIALTSLLSFYVISFHQMQPILYDLFSAQMLILLLFQIFLGFIAGLILNIVFEVFSALGQIVSTQIGLGLASIIDPRFGTITSLTHFYTFAIIIVFFLLNGHLLIIKTMLDSFAVLPLEYTSMPKNMINDVLKYSGIIFSGSIMLSMTVVIAILLTNFALAVMTKFAPQFNLFSIGVNMSLALGLLCVYITFSMLVANSSNMMNECIAFLQNSLARLR